MSLKYLLFETASGYALFERKESEEIGSLTEEFQQSVQEFSSFKKLVELKGFCPFTSAESALENINDVTEGVMNKTLKDFLESQGLPKVKDGKKAKASLGVSDAKLGGSIKDGIQVDCQSNETVLELLRGIRLHIDRFVKGLEKGDFERAQVGLGHGYSRSKVKFNIHRVDNMIIQAINILDQIDKDINTFAMRIKEWYSWHFPELSKVVPEIKVFVKLANFIQNKKTLLDDSKKDGLLEVCDGDEALAKAIVDAARASMGADLSEVDMLNVISFSDRVLNLITYRKQLHEYLQERMNACAPNLTALIGEQVGARLIAKAGSLTNLSKAPASTVQILGAEKALFRALKTNKNTPKYGLIYHSNFITRASTKNKGRISRYLANKCSIASRIDCFSDETTDEFGKKMREQVEERLEFFNSGKVPRKNIDVMHEVMESLKPNGKEDGKKEKKEKKRKTEEAAPEAAPEADKADKKKKKKEKEAQEESKPAEEEPKKKKSKKSKE